MPIFRYSKAFEIARGLKAFLRLDAGLTRGSVPDPEQQLAVQARRLRQAQNRVKKQARQIERLRERLSKARKPERSLTILDDVFPHALSAFRIAEYNAYLQEWPDAAVFSTARSFGLLGETRSFEEVLGEYERGYPRFGGRVRRFGSEKDLAGSKLAYTMFLNSAFYFLNVIEEQGVPFVFTLYPGGGLRLDDQASDEKLRRICSSPNLRKVIATQKISRDYLLEKKFCPPEQVEFVYGGVFPLDRLLDQSPPKQRYKKDKGTFDVCFVAHKYTEKGVEKGYDVFVEVAKLLAEAHPDFRFHVLGPYDESDVDVGGLGGRIAFYGSRPTEFFPAFYARMDAIISPNAPFLLAPGAFDSFPTGGCIEAGSCGVAVFCTDPLDQNVAFEDSEEIVVVPRDAGTIGEALARYRERPEDLYALAARGQRAFLRVFDLEAQMKPRMRILSEAMGGEPPVASEALGAKWNK